MKKFALAAMLVLALGACSEKTKEHSEAAVKSAGQDVAKGASVVATTTASAASGTVEATKAAADNAVEAAKKSAQEQKKQ